MSQLYLASGRTNQKVRTRQALLRAGRELLDAGRHPRLEEVAAAALVSRATAYRYFASVEDLVAEALVEQAVPDPSAAFGDRTELVDRVLAAVAGSTEPLLDDEVATHMIAKSMADRWLSAPDRDARTRPGRRLGLIDAALAPHADRLGAAVTDRLRSALALVCGMEAVISARDVVGLDRRQASGAFAWASAALVAAAERQASAAAGDPAPTTAPALRAKQRHAG